MRRTLPLLFLLASCGPEQSLQYDLDPIELGRAPVQPGGALVGGLLAKVGTPSGAQLLLVDSAFPLNSLSRTSCPSPTGWTYSGDMDVLDGWNPTAPLRAAFRNVGLFDICPGPSGDVSTQAVGVLGGPLLANFAVSFTFPRSSADPASMTFWPSYPGTDDQLAQNGYVSLHFDLRGGAPAAQNSGEASLTLPNSRVVLAACAAPRSFSTTETQETCVTGETALKSSGENLLLAVGTGEGPLILSQSAWERVALTLGLAPDAGAVTDLYTPFSTTPETARFLSLPRLAIFQGTSDNTWIGACAELARARRIEWVLANQDQDRAVCFQPCDASGGQAFTTTPYLELGGDLPTAVVSDASSVIQGLYADVPPNPQIDGIIGAATLAGTNIKIDYTTQPDARFIAACAPAETRATCWSAPSCPSLSSSSQTHTCFAQPPRGWAPVCP